MSVASVIAGLGPVGYWPLQDSETADPINDGSTPIPNRSPNDYTELVGQAHATLLSPIDHPDWTTLCGDGSTYIESMDTAFDQHPAHHRGWGNASADSSLVAAELPAPLFSYDEWTVLAFTSEPEGGFYNRDGLFGGADLIVPRQTRPPWYAYWSVGDPYNGPNPLWFSWTYRPQTYGGGGAFGHRAPRWGNATETAWSLEDLLPDDSIGSQFGFYTYAAPNPCNLVAIRWRLDGKLLDQWDSGFHLHSAGAPLAYRGWELPDAYLPYLASTDNLLRLWGGWDPVGTQRYDPDAPGYPDPAEIEDVYPWHTTYGGRMAHLAVFDRRLTETELRAVWEAGHGPAPPYNTSNDCGCQRFWGDPATAGPRWRVGRIGAGGAA